MNIIRKCLITNPGEPPRLVCSRIPCKGFVFAGTAYCGICDDPARGVGQKLAQGTRTDND